jgi:hypothetical protein
MMEKKRKAVSSNDMDEESELKEDLEDYEDAWDFLDDTVEDDSNYDLSDEEWNYLDELLDETIENADPEVNVASEVDSSNFAMVAAEDELDRVIGKFLSVTLDLFLIPFMFWPCIPPLLQWMHFRIMHMKLYFMKKTTPALFLSRFGTQSQVDTHDMTGMKWVLHYVNCTSVFSQILCLPSKSSAVVGEAIVHMLSASIQSDNASEFLGESKKPFCQLV